MFLRTEHLLPHLLNVLNINENIQLVYMRSLYILYCYVSLGDFSVLILIGVLLDKKNNVQKTYFTIKKNHLIHALSEKMTS